MTTPVRRPDARAPSRPDGARDDPALRGVAGPGLLAGAGAFVTESDEAAEVVPARAGWRRYLAFAASVALALVAGAVLWHLLSDLDAAQVKAALLAVTGPQLALAAGCTVLSYLLLTGYDWLGLRHLGRRLPWPVTACGSFGSFAVSFTLGFPLVTAAAVRYAVYAPRGLSVGDVARLTLVAGLTFWLGMGSVLGLALLAEGRAIVGEAVAVLPGFLRGTHAAPLAGAALLAGVAAYVVLVARRRPTLVMRGWRIRLPGPKTTLMQVALGAADVAAAAGVLYVLLPGGHGIAFGSFVAIYVVAAALGVASHVPGGAGAFEAIILLALAELPREALVGSLLLYRMIYYLAPFLLALALLGGTEIARRAARH